MWSNLKYIRLVCLALLFQSLIAFSPAYAGSTNYTYDSLRRVTKATYPNGVSISYQYDNAGNIISVISSGGTPPPTNLPPVANPDSLSLKSCQNKSLNVVANDTDPENNVPLSLVSVGTSSKADAFIVNSTTLSIDAFDTSGSTTITYVVQDSLGAQSTGTVNIAITKAVCQ